MSGKAREWRGRTGTYDFSLRKNGNPAEDEGRKIICLRRKKQNEQDKTPAMRKYRTGKTEATMIRCGKENFL